MKVRASLLLMTIILLCTGCNQEAKAEIDYDETKKMVVDILKTDDGKKAVREVLADEEMKNELIMNDEIVSKTIEENLTSKKGEEFWKKRFEDEEFTKTYAKALRSEHKKVLKELAKDPSYRKMIVDSLKEPDIKKEMTEIMKSNELRKIYKELILETADSPLVKAELEEKIQKAASEAVEKEGKGEGK